MQTFHEWIQTNEDLRKLIPAVAGAAMAFAPQAKAQDPDVWDKPDQQILNSIDALGSKPKIYIDDYANLALSTGKSLFKDGLKDIDGFKVSVSTYTGRTGSSDGVKSKTGLPSPEEGENSIHSRMDFKVVIYGDNVHSLSKDQLQNIGRKAILSLNNTKDTTVGNLPYKPVFSFKDKQGVDTSTWNAIYPAKRKDTQGKTYVTLNMAAFMDLPLYYKQNTNR